VNFFMDRNIGVRLARMLDAYDAKNTVRHQDDDSRFDKNTTDRELLTTLANEKPRPVFLTADLNMYKRRPDERKALAESRLTVVFLRRRFHHLPFHTQAVKLLKLWPQIVMETGRARQATAFEITPAATKTERLGPTADLLD